jgi:hypothetical protein
MPSSRLWILKPVIRLVSFKAIKVNNRIQLPADWGAGVFLPLINADERRSYSRKRMGWPAALVTASAAR